MDESAWLEFASGERIYFQDSCSIGRSPGNRVILPTDKVSRRHAAIRRESDGSYQVLDFGSSNGTYVNGQRISAATRLTDGAILEIGLQKMIFRRAGGEPLPSDRLQSDAECWLLVIDSSALGARIPGEDLSDKTFESWTARCERVVKKFRGQTMRALNEGLLVLWPASGADRGVRNVAAALRSLRAAQMHNEEFRFGLHFGSVHLHGQEAEVPKPTGENVLFILRMQRLLSAFKPAMIVSTSAAEKLAVEMPVRRLAYDEKLNHNAAEEFFTLME